MQNENNNNGTKSETKTGVQNKKKRSWTLKIETAKSKAPIEPAAKEHKKLFEGRRKEKTVANTEWISRSEQL